MPLHFFLLPIANDDKIRMQLISDADKIQIKKHHMYISLPTPRRNLAVPNFKQQPETTAVLTGASGGEFEGL